MSAVEPGRPSGRGPGARAGLDVEVGRTAPAWTVRAVVAFVGSAALVLPWPGGVLPVPVVVLAVALALVVGLRPRSGAAGVLVVAAGLRLAVQGPAPLWALCTLVLLVHGTVWLATWAGRVPFAARVELAVLRSGLRRFLVVQVPAQAVAVLVVTLAQPSVGASDVARIVGLVAAAAVTVLALPRAGADEED
jgi:hypothetical protein